MEAAQRAPEESRVPATAGAAPSRGRADPPRPSELGRERAAPGRHPPAMLRAPALRGRGERVRAAGIGAGGRPSGEPALARAGGTLSLSGVPGALRRPLALLGAESRSGTRLPALDLARLEDEAPRRLDRVERGAATTQLALDRQPRAVSDSALGAREGTGQQDSGALRAPAARKLGTILRVPSAAAGNAGGRAALSRNLLPRCQLDLSGADHRSGSHGPGTQDRKSTRLNSSHGYISYAVFCLKKKIQECSMAPIPLVTRD